MVRQILFSNGLKIVDVLHNEDFMLTAIDGLSPRTNVYITQTATLDGGYYESSISEVRHITMTLQFRQQSSEEVKRELYALFPTHKFGSMRYISDMVDFTIRYQVEEIDIPLTSYPMTVQIKLQAPDYFFENTEGNYILGPGSFDLWEFPWELPISDDDDDNIGFEFATLNTNRNIIIHNYGEVATGAIIETQFRANTDNPIFQNVNTFEFIKIEGHFIAGDFLRINTVRGSKSVHLIRSGQTTDIINQLAHGSVFLQFEQGYNEITTNTESGSIDSLQVIIYLNERFSGV